MNRFEILEKIKQYETIIIHRHIRPDGDCIGSQAALKMAIEFNFPSKHVYAVGDVIPDYCKQYGIIDEVSDNLYENALVIVVDTGSDSRICDQRYKLGSFIIKIDHHDDSSDYGDINYVKETVPACCAIVADLLESFNFKINKEIAEALYFGITTDTGRFRFRGINEYVFNIAGKLLSYGIDTEDLYTKLYMKDAATLKLQGYVYQNYKLTKNKVAYFHFTKDIMKKFNVTKEEASNLVNSLDSIKGSLIWCVFVDQSTDLDETDKSLEEIRVRIRSRFVAINGVASMFRGGGHLCAAGATIYSKKEKNQLLKKLDEELKNYKENHVDCI